MNSDHMNKIQELATEISNLLFENHVHHVSVTIDEDRFDISEVAIGVPMKRYEDQ